MEVKTFVDVWDKKDKRIIKALEKIEWRPNFTELSKATGIPVTTLFDRWKTMQEKKGYNMKAVVTANDKEWQRLEEIEEDLGDEEKERREKEENERQ